MFETICRYAVCDSFTTVGDSKSTSGSVGEASGLYCGAVPSCPFLINISGEIGIVQAHIIEAATAAKNILKINIAQTISKAIRLCKCNN